MPEPHHRCADLSCGQTLSAHEDPEVETCSCFKVPAYGGAYQELEASARTVGNDNGRPIQVVLYADARRAATLAHEAGVAEGAAENAEGAAENAEGAAENAEAVENWGAFDYELLLLADEAHIPTEGLSPLEIVRALMDEAALDAEAKVLGN
jgi:hypothetical protein